MSDKLRYNIADERLTYKGKLESYCLNSDRLIEFNQRHLEVLRRYKLKVEKCEIFDIDDHGNSVSNLGVLRNRQVRQSVILSAALSAIAVGLNGRGKLFDYPEAEHTKDLQNHLKRANDRTAAQVMAEVLQITTESLPRGEDVLIESAITEGVRVKPGKEAGGNPTIAVGAVFGKDENRANYGLEMPKDVALLSMGNDVIDGTTKSIKGLHSSLTALFVTESNIKRHLPDIYVQRWMSGAHFDLFNPREVNSIEAANIIADAYGHSDISKLSSFFLDRPRHYPAMDALNKAGVATPFDKDGDLMPSLVLGTKNLNFPDGRELSSMIGEIGGSAEWAVGVLPLVWRGGQAIGMLTSQSSLTRKDLTPEQLWSERFHFTEEEFMQIQDARFERKPYFTINDIIEDPFAGGISAFGAISDNYFVPNMEGVRVKSEENRIECSVYTINSLGMTQLWKFTFAAEKDIKETLRLMTSPKQSLEALEGSDLEKKIASFIDDEHLASQYRIFFNNEYYPALIPVRNQMVLLHQVIDGLIERGALNEHDKKIIEITERIMPEWFTH